MSLADLILDFMEQDGRLAVPVAAILSTSGVDPAEIDQAIGGLLDAEYVECWQHPKRGLCLTLKAWVASARGLVIASFGDRWLRKGSPRSKLESRAGRRTHERNATDSFGEFALEVLANQQDPKAVDPLAKMMVHEAQVKAKADVFPIRLLGLGLTWPVEVEDGEPCPGCRDRKLAPNEFCLICDRPLGTLVYRAKAANRRRDARREERLRGGVGASPGPHAA